MKLFSLFKKEEEESPQLPEREEGAEAPQEEEVVALGTKVKVVAALAVVGFATYVAYWVQEPADFKAQVITPDTPAAEEVLEAAAPEAPQESLNGETETMVAAVDTDIDGPTQEVAIIDFTFTPANITVEEGTTVVWTNIDAVDHTVTSDFFTSDVLKPGDSFLYTFEQEGTLEYFCSIHPQMKGKVNVSAAATAPVEDLPNESAVVSVDEENPTEVLSPDIMSVEALDPADSNPDIVTLNPEEFLQEPPTADDDTLILSLPTEAESHTAASETPGALAKSGPEDVLYIGLFAAILYMNRRRLGVRSAQ